MSSLLRSLLFVLIISAVSFGVGYLERPSFKANGKWDGLREAAKQMEFRLAQEEMLYGLPQLAPKAAPSPQRPRP